MFLGDADKLIPVRVLENFREEIKKAGSRCETRVYPGAGHGFFNKAPYLNQTLRAADDFLASLGWLNGPPTLNPEEPAKAPKPTAE